MVAEPAPAPESDDAPDDTTKPPSSGSDSGSEPGGGTDEPDPPKEPEEPAEPENPAEPPEVPEEPETPETPGLGSALDELLASLGLSDLPGIDLATATLDEIWNLLFGTFSDAADDAESAAGD